MNFGGEKTGDLEISLTPMIDVVFLLLIFFMVSTSFERETAVRVVLPSSSGEIEQQPPQAIEITIDAQGRYYVNKDQVVNQRIDTLKAALQHAAGDDRSTTLIISADATTPHQAVITAMDAAGQLGFERLSFATRHQN